MVRVESLALAVRLPVVARYTGELMPGVAVMLVVSGIFALATGNPGFAIRVAPMLVIVLALALSLRRFRPASDLQLNESLLIVALLFLIGSATMIWPFMGEGLSLADATFESISALTTT